MTNNLCAAVLRGRGSEPVVCERPAGHDGAHSGHTERSYIDWSPDATEPGAARVRGMIGSSEDEERASYADIEVKRCVYCGVSSVSTFFIFVQPAGLRVAVPGRVGLCGECDRLLRVSDFDGVLERAWQTSFADFPDDAVLDLIKASRIALLRD